MREATEADMPRLLEIGQKFYDRSPYKSLGPYDKEAAQRAMMYMVNSPDALVLTNEHGAIGGLLVPVWFSPTIKVAEVQFNEFRRGGLAAILEFEKVVSEMGAMFMHLSRFADHRMLAGDRMLAKIGFRPVEHRYVKEL